MTIKLPLLPILAAVILATSAACGYLYKVDSTRVQERLLAEVMARDDLRAKQLAGAVAQQMSAVLRLVEMASLQLSDAYGLGQPQFRPVLASVLKSFPTGSIDQVVVVDPTGHVAYSADGDGEGIFLGDRPYFRFHAAGGKDVLFIGDPLKGRLNGKWVIPVSRAMRRDGRFLGVMIITLQPTYLADTLASISLNPGDVVALVQNDGTFVARSHGLEEALGHKTPADRPFLAPNGDDGRTFRAMSIIDNVPMDFAWKRLDRWPMIAIMGLDETPELAPIRAAIVTNGLRGNLAVAVLTIFSVVVAGLMLWAQRQKGKLATSEQRYRILFANAKAIEMLIDPANGAIVDANAAASEFYGYGIRRLKEMFVSDLNILSRAEIAEAMAAAQAGLRRQFDFRHRLASGEIRDVEVHSGPLKIAGRDLLFSLIHDVTDHRAAEQAIRQLSRRMQDVLAAASEVAIIATDQHGKITLFNSGAEKMLGYTEAEVVGILTPGAFRLPEDLRARSDGLAAELGHAVDGFDILVTKARIEGRELREWTFVRKDGTPLTVSLAVTPVRSDTGEITGYLGVAIDITERKQAEQQLRVAATTFESQEGMIVTDADSVILRVNRAFTEITGYSADEVVGQTTNLLKSGRHDVAFYTEMWESLGRQGIWQGEIWNRRKNGEVYPEWLTITAVRSETGEITHYVATLTDITLRKAAEDEIRHLAFFDPLTRLPNRRLLLDRLQQALASSTRSGRGGGLLFIDLDNFKTLNDTCGHDTGDHLLQEVARRLTTCVREGDTVARLGGDEFVVMLEALNEHPRDAAAQIKMICEKILATLDQPYTLFSQEHHSTASIGATLFGEHRNSVDELLKQADIAMYQAKAEGRNTLRFFDPELQAAVKARASLEADLRNALRDGQFILYYQPQMDGPLGLTGAEALVRWQHPERGLVSPAEFIGLAEETGLILPLGHWVLETACAQMVAWSGRPETAHLTMAVNVSARQFRQDDFVDQVTAVLNHSGADPRKLKLELTESMLLDNVEDIIAKMTLLKASGISFSLDDFGTGYSSLSYLKRLPLSQLKIDQSFVRDVEINPNDAAIARTIVTLAKSLGLSVIAEGVETEEQRAFLSGQGCNACQGYLFGRPVPLSEFESLLGIDQGGMEPAKA